jgi:hypothetical protein
MVSLSLQLAQWNWITRADARYLQWDGKKIATREAYYNNVVKTHHIIHHMSSNSMC